MNGNRWWDYYMVRWSYADGACSGWLNERFADVEDADMCGSHWITMTAIESDEPEEAVKSLSYSIHGFNNV